MKRILLKLLNYFGYTIIKTPRTYLFKKSYQVKVGNFEIEMPANNPLIKTYKIEPEFSKEIGRLASYIFNKYPGLIFLDVGGNTGDTIAIVKSSVDIPVISIEGDPFTFGFLQKNTSQFKSITLFNSFLGEKKETIKVELQKKGWNTTLVPNPNALNTVEITTLDTLIFENFQDQTISKIKFLKIDTEGFDTIIIRGGINFIKTAKPAILFEYNRDNMRAINEDGLTTLWQLEKIGYECLLFYDDKDRLLLSTTLNNKEIIENLHYYADGKKSLIYYYNIFLLHKEDSDLAKIITAKERLLIQESQKFIITSK